MKALEVTDTEICAHLREAYGADVSKSTISTITDKVMDGMAEWQNRPLDRDLGPQAQARPRRRPRGDRRRPHGSGAHSTGTSPK
ncbi:transposase [Nocardia thraciensis]